MLEQDLARALLAVDMKRLEELSRMALAALRGSASALLSSISVQRDGDTLVVTIKMRDERMAEYIASQVEALKRLLLL